MVLRICKKRRSLLGARWATAGVWFGIVVALLIPSRVFAAPNEDNPGCPSGISVMDFYVGVGGDVTNSGGTREGPVCVRVHYNRFRFNLGLNFQTTRGKGVDLSSVLLTGSLPSAAPGGAVDPRVAQLNSILTSMNQLSRNASAVGDGVDGIKALVAFVDNSIVAGSVFPEGVAKEKYQALIPALVLGRAMQIQALPTDLVFGVCPQSPGAPAPGSVLDILQGYRADNTFYTANQANIDSALSLANLYRCGATKQTALTTNVAILKFWDSRFQELGLRTDITDTQLAQLSLADSFVATSVLACGNIFNQSSTTTASLTVYDESQTLAGNLATPSPHQDGNFFTLTCASPFSVSGGVEFSAIPAREFGIVKSTGGVNNTSVNTFGYSSQSPFHPLPVAVVHVRLWESPNQKYAFHASAGASGNIQGQNSGGSSAEFLMGGSFSFFRTMFVTAGLHIGTKTSLAGGFKIGDQVPTDVTTVPVTKSYATGFGLAITFTKP
jgi:hypothetical protein